MFTHDEVEKLRRTQAAEPVVLSLYLPVPLDPAGLRALPAAAAELMAGANTAGPARLTAADRAAVLKAIATRGPQWRGHAVAVFVCGQLDLFEVLVLPSAHPARGLLATRPHVRPLLAALQRCPDYRSRSYRAGARGC